jgi:predicted transcriptional regulator YdeE
MQHPLNVVTKPETKLVGLGAPLAGAAGEILSPAAVIPALWQRTLPLVAELKTRVDQGRYAIIEDDLFVRGPKPFFRALVAVTSFEGAPAPLERYTISAGRYAVFEHRGSPRAMSQTVLDVRSQWGGKVPGLFAKNLEIVAYPAGYDMTDPNATFEIWFGVD